MEPLELAARGWTRETRIRRDRRGTWFEDGVAVEHPRICAAFDRWVHRAPDGRYCLKNEIHWLYVEIEGPPVFVRAARVVDGRVELYLSDQRREVLEGETLRQGPEGALYCTVRGGTLAARFDNAAAMQLEDVIDEDDEGVFVRLSEIKVRPPTVEDPIYVDLSGVEIAT